MEKSITRVHQQWRMHSTNLIQQKYEKKITYLLFASGGKS